MTTGLDALLAALYVFTDDHVAPRRRTGRPPKLTDAELLCPAVAQVLLGFPNYADRLPTSESGDKGQLMDGSPSYIANGKALVQSLDLDDKVVFASSEAAKITRIKQFATKHKRWAPCLSGAVPGQARTVHSAPNRLLLIFIGRSARIRGHTHQW